MFRDIATVELNDLGFRLGPHYRNALKSSLSWGTGIEK